MADFMHGLLAGGMVAFAALSIISATMTDKLGQAICEEEYGLDLDYVSFPDGNLICKTASEKRMYDGIVVMYDDIEVELTNESKRVVRK